jgi:molybdate transport system substrate-binding protein
MRKTITVLVFLAFLSCAAFSQRVQLIVSAAASLIDVLTELQPAAEAFVGARVLFNFAGSGALRRQIEEGAPVDVFFSAASSDMDRLQDEGMIAAAGRRDLLSNAVVLIGTSGSVPASSVEELRPLLAKADLLAIGNPDSVPAGRYAVQVLTTLGLYPVVERKLVLGGSVREVLQYVESGSAPLGIVFVTDALSAKPGSSLRQLFQFPADAVKTPIVYPLAVVSASKHRIASERMVDFLSGETALEVFRRAGFTVK